MMKFIITLLLTIGAGLVNGQANWELKKHKDEIKVYTRDIPNSTLKAVKVTCSIPATLSQLTALLLDTKAHEVWVYNTKSSYLVKQVSPHQQIYYSEINLPWPLTNRDVVVHMSIVQDPATKVMRVQVINSPHEVPVRKGIVRVPDSHVEWTVTPVSANLLSIEYVGRANPGGSVPAWVVNAFSTKGPYETFKRLKQLVASADYASARYPFIKE